MCFDIVIVCFVHVHCSCMFLLDCVNSVLVCLYVTCVVLYTLLFVIDCVCVCVCCCRVYCFVCVVLFVCFV